MNGQSPPGQKGDSRGPLFVAAVAVLLLTSAVVGAGGVLAQSPAVDSASQSIQANENPSNGGPAAVSANYQSSDGEKATVSSATLPNGGYVGIYRYADNGNSLELIGTTGHIGAGTRENITVGLFDVPGKEFSTNALDSTTFLVTRIHQDTNDNDQFDYASSSGSEDGFYTNESDQPVSDSDYLTLSGSDSSADDSDSNSDSDSSDSSSSGSDDASSSSDSSATSTTTVTDEDSADQQSDSDSSDSSTSSGDLAERVANAGPNSGGDTGSDDSDGTSESDESDSSDDSDSSDSDVSNTFRVRSLGEERTRYNLSVDGEIELGSRFDESNAQVPDTRDGNSVSGSVAKRGMDNLTFSGEIQTLTVSNGNANVSVNGEQVDADDYLNSTSESDTDDSDEETTTDESSDSSSDESSESDESDSSDGGEDADDADQEVAADVETESNTGAGGSIAFEDQRTDGGAVTIDSATLPSQGFVVLHGPAYTSAGILEGSVIAVSDSLSEGEHENITLEVGQNVPDERYNSSSLEGSGNYTAIAYRDTNTNDEYEYLSDSGTDIPFLLGSGDNERLLRDDANVTVAGTRGDPELESSQQYANVSFPDQDSSGTSVTVGSTHLPDGGFVAIHNETYLPPENDSIGSVIGVSRYLEPGNHTNVEVQLYSGVPGANFSQSSLDSSMTLTASAAQDVNRNLTYNFVTSRGAYDVGYLNEGGSVVDEQADVTLADSDSAFTTSDLNESESEDDSDAEETVGQFGNETITPTPSENESVASDLNESDSGNVDPNQSVEIDERQVATPTPTNESAQDEQSGGIASSIFTGLTIIAIVALAAALIVGYIVVSRR